MDLCLLQYKYTVLKMYNLVYTSWSSTSDMAPRIRRLLWKQMHISSVEVHGEGLSTSCYDSVVKYLLRSCRGRCVEKSACQTKKTAKKCPILHSGPLRKGGLITIYWEIRKLKNELSNNYFLTLSGLSQKRSVSLVFQFIYFCAFNLGKRVRIQTIPFHKIIYIADILDDLP